jgi:hypothetical protein
MDAGPSYSYQYNAEIAFLQIRKDSRVYKRLHCLSIG